MGHRHIRASHQRSHPQRLEWPEKFAEFRKTSSLLTKGKPALRRSCWTHVRNLIWIIKELFVCLTFNTISIVACVQALEQKQHNGDYLCCLCIYKIYSNSTLLEGNVDTAGKGASLEFGKMVEGDVMGNPLYGASTEQIKNSAAIKQRDLNHNWNKYGAVGVNCPIQRFFCKFLNCS